MTRRLWRDPNPHATMLPIEGLRFYADALRGDWGSIDGRSEKRALNAYIDWAVQQHPHVVATDVVLAKVEELLDVVVVEYVFDDGTPSSYNGVWTQHADDEIAARDEATRRG